MAKRPAADAACPKGDDVKSPSETFETDDEEFLDEVKRLYADPTIKSGAIAEKIGWHTVQLNRLASAQGWGPRPKLAGTTSKVRKPNTEKPKAVKPPPVTGAAVAKIKSRAPKPIALLRHVCSTIEGELTKLDRQNGDTSQDRERASRALSQMVNSLEKTIGMQSEVTKDTAKGSNTKQKDELAHADDLRRQIAERLERLQQKRASTDGPAGIQ
jgi:hypothetical protein